MRIEQFENVQSKNADVAAKAASAPAGEQKIDSQTQSGKLERVLSTLKQVKDAFRAIRFGDGSVNLKEAAALLKQDPELSMRKGIIQEDVVSDPKKLAAALQRQTEGATRNSTQPVGGSEQGLSPSIQEAAKNLEIQLKELARMQGTETLPKNLQKALGELGNTIDKALNK